MLSDATRIVEIDMPYAEREGESKLRVLRDGFRFLRVILENALLYRPGRVLLGFAATSLLISAALMFPPLIGYLRTRTVAEWMIYRFLVSSLGFQVALLLWGAAAVSARLVSIAIREEVHQRSPTYVQWLRTGWFWALEISLVSAGAVLIWPSAVELWRSGHTDVHWSRFVVAMGCFGSAALFGVFRGIDTLLDLVERRVLYLWKRA